MSQIHDMLDQIERAIIFIRTSGEVTLRDFHVLMRRFRQAEPPIPFDVRPPPKFSPRSRDSFCLHSSDDRVREQYDAVDRWTRMGKELARIAVSRPRSNA